MFRVVIAMAVLVGSVAPAASASAPALVPPVDGAVVRGFENPGHEFGPGHRGVDLAATPGTPVRAAAQGTVTFAGPVAGVEAVTIEHAGGLETTYSRLEEVLVRAGDVVEQGTWVGRTGHAHDGVPGLHLGVKLDGAYIDPAALLTALDLSGALRLAPLLWEPSDDIPEPLAAALRPTGPGSAERECRLPVARRTLIRPPNDNIAVAVAGIGSKTEGRDQADMYHPGPGYLGYPDERTYLFSYRGPSGPDLHEDYPRTDTYGDLRAAARGLARLLRAIASKHPGTDVDLIAHSQGGVVARTYLTRFAGGSVPGLPRVEHFVTLATPHTGAPIATNVKHLRSKTLSGPPLLSVARRAAAAGLPVPDPDAPAVGQLAPGSGLLESLEARDVSYGTRVLTLGIANDLVVPADRTSMPRGRHHVIGPPGGSRLPPHPADLVGGHSAIVTAPESRSIVYDFLRGAADACPTVWDTAGRHAGRAISWTEARIGAAVERAEGILGRAVRSVFDL